MPALDQTLVQNRLLALMSAEDFSTLQPNLKMVTLAKGFIMVEPEQTIEHIYFLDSGVGSIITISKDGDEAEGGLFGREGAGPLNPLMGSQTTPNRVLLQVVGGGWRIEAAALSAAVEASATLRNLLLRYTHTLSIQMTYTALSNAVHPVEARLARWILMCDDRVDGDLPLTHEFMAIMLAVRRPTVTTCLHELEGRHLIRSERGCVIVRDRMGLEAFARDAYGKPEAEYRRLIGPMSPPHVG